MIVPSPQNNRSPTVFRIKTDENRVPSPVNEFVRHFFDELTKSKEPTPSSFLPRMTPDIPEEEKNRSIALKTAVKARNLEMVITLCNEGSIHLPYLEHAISIATKNADEEILSRLLATHLSISSFCRSKALLNATLLGNMNMIRMIVPDASVELIPSDRQHALKLALQRNDMEAARYLLDQFSDKDRLAVLLNAVAEKKDLKFFKQLFHLMEPIPNQCLGAILIMAAETGQDDLAAHLMKNPSRILPSDYSLAVKKAVRTRHPSVVQTLVKEIKTP